MDIFGGESFHIIKRGNVAKVEDVRGEWLGKGLPKWMEEVWG